MKVILSMTLVFVSVLFVAETDTSAVVDVNCDRDFANQGEAEQCWAVRLFHNEYKAKRHPKFKGEIIRSGDTFHFGEREIEVGSTDANLMQIFEKGLLYPEMFSTPGKVGISAIEEIQTPAMPRGAKRFKFWMWHEGFTNPSVYFFELKNKHADPDDMKLFVNGSTLTFFHYGWVIV